MSAALIDRMINREALRLASVMISSGAEDAPKSGEAFVFTVNMEMPDQFGTWTLDRVAKTVIEPAVKRGFLQRRSPTNAYLSDCAGAALDQFDMLQSRTMHKSAGTYILTMKSLAFPK